MNNTTTVKQAIDKATQHLKNRRPNDALKMYNDILSNHPNNINILYERAKLYHSHNQPDAALKDFTTLLDLSPDKHILYGKIGDIHASLKQHEKAIKFFVKAINDKPEHIPPYIPLIGLLERFNRLEQANEIITNGLVLSPKSADLYFLQGKIYRNQKQFEEAETAYKKSIDLNPNTQICHVLWGEYAITKEKLKKYDEAMQACITSQTYAAKTPTALKETSELSMNIVNKSRPWFKANDIKGWNDETYKGTQAPVFLMGFPRSGTTLMEQILLAHPHLTVTDELQVLPAKVHFINKILGRDIPYPQGFNTLSHDEITTWRNEYFKGIDRLLPEKNPDLRIVDKNPTSFYYLGVINRFFPDSPAIMMIRDPRDSCLSCLFQTFAPNSDTVNFYTLENTVNYYAEIMSLYLQFRDTLDVNLLQVKYEDMCADFEPHARTIFKHIDEPWNDKILTYYQQKERRYIQTPSYDAVTKPINTKAIAKWKHYEKYFEPYMHILQPFLNEFGYE